MRLYLITVFAALACPAKADEAVRLGIYGLVESVAPLVVAGREILLGEGVRVLSPLGTDQKIALGDTLAVVVRPDAKRLIAERILEIYPIVGTIGAATDTVATVMGTSVYLPADVTVKRGSAVALSGFWSGEMVIATAVHRIEWDGYGQLVGALELPEPLRIGGTALIGAEEPQDGFGDHIWMLSGVPEDQGLHLRLMAKGVFGGAVDLSLWQGHASAPIASQTYMIHGIGIVGTARDAQMPAPGAMITRCAVQGRVVHAAPSGLETPFELLDCARHIPAD